MATPQNDDLLRITQSGLIPTEFSSKKIIIIGAGIAGLVSAYELKRAGHQVTVLEAQQRVGGRILTLREPFSHGLYGEAGAMRLPAAHKLTQSYIQKFGLETYDKVFLTSTSQTLSHHRRSRTGVPPEYRGKPPADRGAGPPRIFLAPRIFKNL